jgi:hypothetical protein
MQPRDVAQMIAAARTVYGAAMSAFPRMMLRIQGEPSPSGNVVWLARAFGLRDAALGAGALRALQSGRGAEWVAVGALCDAGDAVAALIGSRGLGRGRALGLAAFAGSSAAGGWQAATALKQQRERN